METEFRKDLVTQKPETRLDEKVASLVQKIGKINEDGYALGFCAHNYEDGHQSYKKQW